MSVIRCRDNPCACVCRIRDRLRRTRERATVSGFGSVHWMVLMFVPVRVDEDVRLR